jgi:hypothetical protein
LQWRSCNRLLGNGAGPESSAKSKICPFFLYWQPNFDTSVLSKTGIADIEYFFYKLFFKELEKIYKHNSRHQSRLL